MHSPTPEPQHQAEHETSRPTEKKELLTDERARGQWQTRYPLRAWTQVVVELSYLVLVVAIALSLLHQIAVATHAVNGPGLWPKVFDGASRHTLALGAVALGGACGGSVFALKWLYHSVAHGWWNCDRVVWRFVVPLLSALLALFTALMIGSGLIPIFSSRIIDGPRIGVAYGFFVGLFSDNLIAALQKLANQTLGTLGRVETGQGRKPDS